MANFKTPHTFVAGTKAKAEEVNENFSAIKDELNKKIDADNEGYITIKDAISDNQPISKAQIRITVPETFTGWSDKLCGGSEYAGQYSGGSFGNAVHI